MERRSASIFGSAFLDGLTGAGFLRRLRRPGAPTRLFADKDGAEVAPEDVERAKRTLVRAGFEVSVRKVESSR